MSSLFICRGQEKKRFCGTFVELIVTLFYFLPPPTRLLFFSILLFLKCRELEIQTFSVHLWHAWFVVSESWETWWGQRYHSILSLNPTVFSPVPLSPPEVTKSQCCVYSFKIVFYSHLSEFMSLSFFLLIIIKKCVVTLFLS